MNHRMILSLLGGVLLLIGAFLLLPCVVALIYGEQALWSLLAAIGVCVLLGLPLLLLKPKANRTMHARDGFVMVSASWARCPSGSAEPSGAILTRFSRRFRALPPRAQAFCLT